ncbi:MAG TPA: XrtA/PEP-CTERM system histidine kinase PrsK [Qipengyuania sp.]|nr:XrtA/PEP-CTERM system histidine kinase PrsK [Qipengyuania sp.]
MEGLIAFLLYGFAAVGCALAAGMVLRSVRTQRRDRGATAAALGLSALWCGAVAAFPEGPAIVQVLEIARNAAWIYALFRHFANDGRDETLRVVRPLVTALLLVEGLQLVLLAAAEPAGAAVEVAGLMRMLVAVGALFLAHNLYGGASDSSRRLLAWPAAGLALFWTFELNLFTVAYLTGTAVVGLEVLRALVMLGVVACFAVGAGQREAGLTFRPSRAVTLSTLSLAVLAAYFVTMVALSNGAAMLSGDLARMTQVGFLLIAATVSLLWLPSARLRGTLRLLALKHLFKHRYDYREEWLRFTRTIGKAAGPGPGLHERAVQSLADIADSPAGLLLTPGEDEELTLAARWRWPTIEVPPVAGPLTLLCQPGRGASILDFDALRAAGEALPEWLRDEPAVWAGVPLHHGERLVGVVILARPHVARRLDWEDFDLLRVAGQQVASYLAEQAGQDALQDAARFDEFNRRMAFVMHDIKNLSSQIGLLARNAERHADNPAFRADMLVTLRNSADKLDAMVSRLGRYGSGRAEAITALDLAALAQRLAASYNLPDRVQCIGDSAYEVLGAAEPLEQALRHLIQNALEASPPDVPVLIEVRSEGMRGEIAVVDAGEGMSPQFLRQDLFRPFVSTKENGFGVGACEARELIRAMGGRLDVQSREGVGSRFTISLPLAEASRLLARSKELTENPMNEKAA